MKLPIDVMAVFQEAMDVDTARSIPLCVSVLLDDTAPADLMAVSYTHLTLPTT